ncbi:hypothetical protein J7S33_19190, partial [Saccharothrix algeriensis]
DPDAITPADPDAVTPAPEPPSSPAPDAEVLPPKTFDPAKPGSMGLGMVEAMPPTLSRLVPNLLTDLKAKGLDLVPDSVLDDSMNNLRRLLDLGSPTSVRSLMDSALDGGVPLLVHKPNTFGKDTYQVTLKANIDGSPKFTGVANDGIDVEHIIAGSTRSTTGSGRGSGWGAGLKLPGAGLPQNTDPNLSGTSAGVSVAVNTGSSTTTNVTDATTSQVGHKRVGTGPVARFDVPVKFELVVERGTGGAPLAQGSVTGDVSVRLHADNLKIAPAPAPAGNNPAAPTAA